jgi:hypothetical protein
MPIHLLALTSGLWLFFISLAVFVYAYFWFSTIWEIANYSFKGKYKRPFWLFFTIITGMIGMLLYYLLGRSDRLQKLEA